MTRIFREQFRNEFQSGIDINNLSDETKTALAKAGISKSKLEEIAHGDGKIEGAEIQQLFDAIDTFDNEQLDGYIDTQMKFAAGFASQPTTEGDAYKALKSDFERSFIQASIKGPEPSINTNKNSAAINSNENGSEAANSLLLIQKSMGSDAATDAFRTALVTHKNDPEWTKAFCLGLGDKAKDFISAGFNHKASKDDVDQYGKSVANALQSLHESGNLSDQNISALMQRASKYDPQTVAKLARSIAELPEGKDSEYFKVAVTNATLDLYKTNNNPRFKSALATSAAEIVGNCSQETQLNFLNQFKEKDKLESFVKDATSFQPVSGLIKTDGIPGVSLRKEVPLGVARLVSTMAGVEPTLTKLPMSTQEFEDLRVRIFNSAADVYGDKRASIWNDSTLMKDGLSRIFQKDFNKLWPSAMAASNATFDNDSGIQRRWEGFFKHALFTEPTGAWRDSTSTFLQDQVKTWFNDITNKNMSTEEFAKKYTFGDKKFDRSNMNYVMAEVLGFTTNGMNAAVNAAKDSAAERRAAQEKGIKFVLDLGLSIIPGGSAFSDGLKNPIMKNIVKGVFDGASKEIKDTIKDMTMEEAAKYLVAEFPELHMDQVMESLYEEIREQVPGSDNQNYLGNFEADYHEILRKPQVK